MSLPRMLCVFSRSLRPQTIVLRQRRVAAPYQPYEPPTISRGSKCYATSESLPRVAQPSLWHSLVPKFFRKSEGQARPPKPQRSKEWNPATFYIIMFMLIGSNAIQMIALRNYSTNFNRNADAKISLLKEVIERVQRGEDVDVEGLLGTGDKAKEREWEDVVREIEEEDRLWQAKARTRRGTERSSEQAKQTSDPMNTPVDEDVPEAASTGATSDLDEPADATTKTKTAYRGFY